MVQTGVKSKVDTDMKFKMMYSFLNLDIDTVEKALEEAVYADSALLREASLHLLQAGGKRIRPYLLYFQLNLVIIIFIRLKK